MNQQIFQREESDKLKSLIRKTDPENIFLVRGKRSYTSSGSEEFINQLISIPEKLTVFNEFDPNPQLEDLNRGISLFKKGNYKLIIAIGGGSVLDMAKLISLFAHQEENIVDLVLTGQKPIGTSTPVLAIPTTAGSGAEATQFAVLYIDKTKHSVEQGAMKPKYVYLSSQFSRSAGPYLTACAGLDAFCQAVESAWSINASDESLAFALDAVRLVWNNLAKAVYSNNIEARDRMQTAAFLAGKAISISKTTVSHALSYAFTSFYHVPHGHAVALSLPFFFKFNYGITPDDCNDSRGVTAVKDRIDALARVIGSHAANVPEILADFFISLGIKMDLNELITDFEPGLISENINLQRLNNNPRRVTSDVILEFLSTYNLINPGR